MYRVYVIRSSIFIISAFIGVDVFVRLEGPVERLGRHDTNIILQVLYNGVHCVNRRERSIFAKSSFSIIGTIR